MEWVGGSGSGRRRRERLCGGGGCGRIRRSVRRLLRPATEAGLSGTDSTTPALPMSEEVKQEPDKPDDVSPGTSTQSGTGDVSRTRKTSYLINYKAFWASLFN